MSYSRFGAATTTTVPSVMVTTVDCQKQVRSWRLLRSVMELLIPTCNCTTFIQEQEREIKNQESSNFHIKFNNTNYLYNYLKPGFVASSASSTMTGTIFGYRRGKISFCIQKTSKSTNPTLLLELAVPTTVLAREMQGGVLRIVLQCNEDIKNQTYSFLSMPSWTMYCNGRKVGYAKKQRPSKDDIEALNILSSVVVGAGVVNGKELGRDDDDQLMYLRANFRRVSGSNDSESFHLIDPAGKIGQELSIFFFRPPV